MGIRSFLFDKEKVLFQGTTQFVVDVVKELMLLSLKYKKKDLYRRLVEFVGDNEDCMSVMEWEKKGVKNWILHN